jgi:hypothetical protein
MFCALINLERSVTVISNVNYKTLKSLNFSSGFLILTNPSLLLRDSSINDLSSGNTILLQKHNSVLILFSTNVSLSTVMCENGLFFQYFYTILTIHFSNIYFGIKHSFFRRNWNNITTADKIYLIGMSGEGLFLVSAISENYMLFHSRSLDNYAGSFLLAEEDNYLELENFEIKEIKGGVDGEFIRLVDYNYLKFFLSKFLRNFVSFFRWIE